MQPATWGWFVALLGWSVLVSSFALTGGAAFEPVDAWVAQTAREMYERTVELGWEGFIVPWFSGEVRLQKSPGPYWLVMGIAWLRGGVVDEFAVRLPSMIACVLMTLTVFWLTRRIAGDRAAIFAGFATSSCAVVLFWTGRGSADMTVATLMAMSLACLWVGSEDEPPGAKRVLLWLAGWLLAGIAMLDKMPMPLACVGLPAFLYVLLCNRWRIFASWWHLVGLLLFLLPWLPWALAIYQYEPQAFAKWEVEFVDRMTGELPNVEEQTEGVWWYFLYVGLTFAFTAPYCLSVPAALGRAFRPDPDVRRRGQWFLLIWYGGLLLFFTFAVGKETRYFLPAVPPIMCLLGIELARFFDPRRERQPALERLGFWAVTLLVPAALAGAIYFFGARLFPKGLYENITTWSALWPPLVTAAAIFSLGAIAAAWLYTSRREHAAFAALVATTWATWLWTWAMLMPVFTSAAPFKELAEALRTKLTPEQQAALHQIAHQDPRIIWYGDVRFPRLVSYTELLEIQGGTRDITFEERYWGERITDALDGDELVLFVTAPGGYVKYLALAPLELAAAGREMPPVHTWLVPSRGHPKDHWLVFGNRPPPWPAPEPPALFERWIAGLRRQALERPAPASRPADSPGETAPQ